MGGKISIEDMKPLRDYFDQREPKPEQDTAAREFFSRMEEAVDHDNVTMAIQALTQIALETKNKSLAEGCIDLITELLHEYAASSQEQE